MKVIIALIGKAGAGKDTIAQALASRNPNWNMIVSCTTRPMRDGEVEGVNYHYLTNEQFAEKVINGDMLEATYFNEWHYGTMASSLKEGVNIGVFNPEGLDCLTSSPLDGVKVLSYYIVCSNKERMIRQLNRERNPNVAEICRRYTADEEDFDEEMLQDFVYNRGLCRYRNEKETDKQDVVWAIEDDIEHLVARGQLPIEYKPVN